MKQCFAITGANGYIGSALCRALGQRNIPVVRLVRHPTQRHDRFFALERPVPVSALEGVSALVHCAWDFKLCSWEQICEVNVRGSLRLFEAAKAAGVSHMIFVSTMSAFEGCRSLYGRAKVEVERKAIDWGVDVIRPGLVYGPRPGGMVGSLAKLSVLPLLPLVGSGNQPVYTTHEDDLVDLVVRFGTGKSAHHNKAVLAANSRAHTFRQFLQMLAAARNKRPLFVPIPWQVIWFALRALESVQLKFRVRSDGLISLVNTEAKPDFESTRETGVSFRDFEPAGLI